MTVEANREGMKYVSSYRNGRRLNGLIPRGNPKGIFQDILCIRKKAHDTTRYTSSEGHEDAGVNPLGSRDATIDGG